MREEMVDFPKFGHIIYKLLLSDVIELKNLLIIHKLSSVGNQDTG